jgi:hypothetical protein
MTSICVEIKTSCAHCGNALPLNALVEKIFCPSCQQMNDFPYDLWKKSILDSALNEYSDLKEGEGQTQTVMTGGGNFSIMYGLQKPRCQKCKTGINPEHFFDYAHAGSTTCGKCSNVVSVRKLPDELVSMFEGVSFIIGEDSDMFTNSKAGMKTPNAVKPILFTCPQCAGNLKIDGTSRVINCNFCNSEIYLPDDLWLRLHPVKTVERWYLVFDDSFLKKTPVKWNYLPDVTIDKAGNLYLATANDDEKFTLCSLGTDMQNRWRKDDLQYSYEHTHLAMAPDGNIYMWDEDKHSLLILSASDGSTIEKIKGTEPTESEPEPFYMKSADDLTIDTDGTIIVLKDDKILRYSREGNRIPTWGYEEKKGFFGKLFGSSEADDSSPDVNELKNHPKRIDSDCNYITTGWDGYIYFMHNSSSDDADIAKYDREGNMLFNILVPIEQKLCKPCIDSNGNIYVLGETKENINLIKYSVQTGKWETLLKDIKQGGTLNEVEKLVITPDASKIYCLNDDNGIRVFDNTLKMIYISDQSKEDDKDTLEEKKEKVEKDEE